MKILKPLEWIPDADIENEIIFPPCFAAKIHFIEHPAVSFRIPWLAQRRCNIKTDYQYGKVASETYPCTHGHLTKKIPFTKPRSGFSGNIFVKPNITCITKGSKLDEFPKFKPEF
jgi:hypothetical protein